MKLLIDSGNSRLKWALLDKQNTLNTASIANRDVTHAQLSEAWSMLNPPEQVFIASVSTHALVILVTKVINELWPNVLITVVKSQAQAYGVTNAYEQADKLGVDRWLALIAAHHHYPGASCIVDCGTAITVDVLAADGTHQGGLITPGLAMMKKSLARETANLSYEQSAYPEGLANATEAGIYNGTLYAAVGLIERVIKQQAIGTQLILTGGDAETIVVYLKSPAIIDPDLVFKGLVIMAER